MNSVEAFSKAITGFFSTVNIVGAIIGGISLIVGLFGIANIMFVTVRERTSMIGLKKAVGAKKSSILFEFLMEATVLCILGGAIGLFFVYILTLDIIRTFKFPCLYFDTHAFCHRHHLSCSGHTCRHYTCIAGG